MRRRGLGGSLGGACLSYGMMHGALRTLSRRTKKLRPGFGGSLAAREPVWDGEGWGCDRVACLQNPYFTSRALAVEAAGRPSPSATQTLGSLCDWRLTKRYPVSV